MKIWYHWEYECNNFFQVKKQCIKVDKIRGSALSICNILRGICSAFLLEDIKMLRIMSKH